MQNASVISYFFDAGMVVKTVMFLLLIASVISWTLIIQRIYFFKREYTDYQNFHHRFTGCRDLTALYKELDTNPDARVGMAAIFYDGFRRFAASAKSNTDSLEAVERRMQIRHAKEEAHLEAHLPWFASVGSIAPYVGLFGTVWGIMTSFQALGQAQQATIAMVAPGISEALVATALGLFTAIPAVIAYNRFSTRATGLLDKYDIFQEELLSIFSKQD